MRTLLVFDIIRSVGTHSFLLWIKNPNLRKLHHSKLIQVTGKNKEQLQNAQERKFHNTDTKHIPLFSASPHLHHSPVADRRIPYQVQVWFVQCVQFSSPWWWQQSFPGPPHDQGTVFSCLVEPGRSCWQISASPCGYTIFCWRRGRKCASRQPSCRTRRSPGQTPDQSLRQDTTGTMQNCLQAGLFQSNCLFFLPWAIQHHNVVPCNSTLILSYQIFESVVVAVRWLGNLLLRLLARRQGPWHYQCALQKLALLKWKHLVFSCLFVSYCQQ